MHRVVVQAAQEDRNRPEDVLNVRSASGGMVPMSAVAILGWRTGQSLEEINSDSQAPILLRFSILFVFLLLAALYNSWTIPISVILVVPLGVIGYVPAVMVTGMSHDVYFKVGLIAIIGLSAKNAILIVDFAKANHAAGMSLINAAVTAAQLRFRPIIMTSLAFTLGVVSLAIATASSSASQNAIGTGVLGGMILATVLAIIFVLVLFVFVLRLKARGRQPDDRPAQ